MRSPLGISPWSCACRFRCCYDLAQIAHGSSLDIVPEDPVVFGVGIGYRDMTARGSV
jgi:hypothetical protein